MDLTPLRLTQPVPDESDSEEEEAVCWSLRIEHTSVVLMLCGGKAKMKAGVVQAVAEGDSGHVQLQSLLSVSLLFPPTAIKYGMTTLKALPLSQAAYSKFRAVNVTAQPNTTTEVAQIQVRIENALLC